MDPVSLIVVALTGGAVAQNTATKAVKDSYTALRALLRQLGKDASVGVDRFEIRPGRASEALAAALKDAGAGDDPAIVAAAQRLLTLLDPAGSQAGKYVVDFPRSQGVMIGGLNVQFDTSGGDGLQGARLRGARAGLDGRLGVDVERSQWFVGLRSPTPWGHITETIPVTIYLSDHTAHQGVQAAVEELLRYWGAEIVKRDDPVLGSWFRRMRARLSKEADNPLTREVARTAMHALDGKLVQAQDATNTATLMQPLAPVLASLQPIKEAVIRVGALLIVKVDDSVVVHQLTATQQFHLDHHPDLLSAPKDILGALNLTQPAALPHQQSPVALTGPPEPDTRPSDFR